MRGKLRRRGAMVAALSAGGMVLATGSASAAALIPLSTTSWAGVYSGHSVGSGKVGVPDLAPGDAIIADCYARGENLGRGNIWYHTLSERYSGSGLELFVTGWTYGANVDGNSAFVTGSIALC
ncbi:hypothetical protein [Streptomyces phaeochromogenes]